MSMHIALRLRIEVAFSFLDFITIEGGTFLDLPSANVTITQLATSSVDTNCESNPIPAAQAKFDKIYQEAQTLSRMKALLPA